MKNFTKNKFIVFFNLIVVLSIAGCVDAVTPEFELKEGLMLIEGFASTLQGSSVVTIKRSGYEFGVYQTRFVENASVMFSNVVTNEIINLIEDSESYVPPEGFHVRSGEQWKLIVELLNGKKYESLSEVVLKSVPISKLDVIYKPKVEYREIEGGRFIPGHDVKISFQDPVTDKNYYYWSFSTSEKLFWCQKCVEGYFRDGECQPLSSDVFGRWSFDYVCDTNCWRIRFTESIATYDDKFSNGKMVNNLSIGNIPLYTKENMVLTVQQLVLQPDAFQYYEVFKDLVDNNSGLNAPPPAGLLGNMYNPNDSEEFVFGRFTAAATSIASIFINRSSISEKPLENRGSTRYETEGSPAPAPQTGTAPCEEGKYRTRIMPPEWVEI